MSRVSKKSHEALVPTLVKMKNSFILPDLFFSLVSSGQPIKSQSIVLEFGLGLAAGRAGPRLSLLAVSSD